MFLPKKVKIAGHVYKIKYLPTVEQVSSDFEGTPCYGYIDFVDFTIVTCSALPIEQIRATLLHEITHAVTHHFNLILVPHKYADEEIITTIVSSGLFSVFSDNPSLAKFLCGIK